MTVVWVCGEGPRDHGEGDNELGALPPMVRRTLHRVPDLVLKGFRANARKHGGFGRRSEGRRREHAIRGLSGNAFRLGLTLLDAEKAGVHGVVFVHDLDGDDPRAHQRALAALSQARIATAELGAPPSAIGVAVPMVEAWLHRVPGVVSRSWCRDPYGEARIRHPAQGQPSIRQGRALPSTHGGRGDA